MNARVSPAPTGESPIRAHTPRDLQVYGQRYGIDYSFPELQALSRPVMRGRVEELQPGPGMQLVASDIEVLERYDSRSRSHAPLTIIVMLKGQAEVSLGGQHLTLRAGMALSVQLEARQGLCAIQPAGQRIRAVTLGLDESRLRELNHGAALEQGSRMRAWHLPASLQTTLEDAITHPMSGPAQRLQLEGLSLQLLAHGLPGATGSKTGSMAAPGERQRLERVRETLRQAPAEDHRLATLAAQASMSPASLRRKYRAAFGQSVFDELREFRLGLARHYLEQGFSVQQAAHFCGYRHASNLATAFRRYFGFSPRNVAPGGGCPRPEAARGNAAGPSSSPESAR
ncbi:helix-turn-helix transcriptional regulator [Halomonas halmophila]|uniref:AraC family transcriptional regulator n=1 Tax=Halomonas halmophila TaxID=252 RepID=A0A4Y4F2Z9_9GAMM|nr:AraC family transcriptional regulator [Halomonas halmophila]GED21511.1 AraC family transcriptional regulator [Halomonas halmophila]